MSEQSTEKRLVFVSHSSQDTWIAKQIAREIQSRGATPFLDEEQVDAGADFEEDILNFLERAHELVVLLTPWALDRPYVWAEIGAAWSKQSNEGRDYLSLKLDDPSFTAPIFANLFDDPDGESYTLIWSRSRKKNGE